jgi:hypothetical protein
VTYRPRERKEQEYRLTPLGIVTRGAVHALVCTKLDGAKSELDQPRTFLLHRMVAATVDPQAAVAPKGFDLAASDTPSRSVPTSGFARW